MQYRYGGDSIYTFAGPVLIALNPCKALPLYTREVAEAYKAAARDTVHGLQPHIYLVAANAFRNMLREKSSQSLIVNGGRGEGRGVKGWREGRLVHATKEMIPHAALVRKDQCSRTPRSPYPYH